MVHGRGERGRAAPSTAGLMHTFLLAPLLRGETLLVLDAANSFNPHRLARLRRRRSEAGAWLERVRVSRAFTCFQLAELIERVPAAARRHGVRRVVVTGLPDIFDDEELAESEARAVFRQALARLRRGGAPVVTTLVFSDGGPAESRPGCSLRAQLERELFRQADGVYRLEETAAGLWLREEKALPGAARVPGQRFFGRRATPEVRPKPSEAAGCLSAVVEPDARRKLPKAAGFIAAATGRRGK